MSAQDVGTYTLTITCVAIYHLAGKAELMSHGGSDVTVQVRRSRGDRAVLRVDVDVIDGREGLRVIYRDDEIRYTSGPRRGRTRLRVHADGTFGHGCFLAPAWAIRLHHSIEKCSFAGRDRETVEHA